MDLPHVLTQDEIMKAIDGAGDENGHSRNIVGKMKIPPHVEPFGKGCKGLSDLRAGDVETIQFPLDAHKENLGRLGGVLSRMHDVPVMLENEIRHRRHNPATIGTGKKEHGIGLAQFISHPS
jgi:hypothetical protein